MHRNTPNGIAFSAVQGPELGLADAYCVRQNGLKHGLQIARRRADDLQYLRGCCQLLQRLVALVHYAVELFLWIGSGYLCGRRVASLGPIHALTLHRLSASTTSLHVAPFGGFTTMLNPRQNTDLAPRHEVRFGSLADMCAAKGNVRFTPNSDRES